MTPREGAAATILETTVLAARNRRFPKAVVACLLDPGDTSTAPAVVSFDDRVLHLLPGLARACEGEPVPPRELFCRIAIELQRAGGGDVELADSGEAGEAGARAVAFEYESPEVGVAAAALALDLLNLATIGATSTDSKCDAIRAFLRDARGAHLRVDGRELVRLAAARDIPADHLGDWHIRFGQGRHQRLLYRTYTDRTAHLGWVLARDKALANRRLSEAGLPVPRQTLVRSLEEAKTAAERLGYPIVVKPRAEDHGIGITVGVDGPEALARAYEEADRATEGVLLEEHIAGKDHRLLVIGGRLAAASRRRPARVVGDGSATIGELIEAENRDPRRGSGAMSPLSLVAVDRSLIDHLARSGRSLDSVPGNGEIVPLRAAANLSLGGTATDVTDRVHPDNRDMAVRAAAVAGLDIAGVDYLTEDIGRSYRSSGGRICEINPTPGLRMHLFPDEGEPRDVAGALLDMLFPDTSARIPIAAVLGSGPPGAVGRLLAGLVDRSGKVVGHADECTATVDDEPLLPPATPGGSVRAVLGDRRVEAAIFELEAGVTARTGAWFDACEVTVVGGPSGPSDPASDDMLQAASLLASLTRSFLVVEAENPLWNRLAEFGGPRVLAVMPAGGGARVEAHLAAGFPAVVLEDSGRAAIHDGGTTRTVSLAEAFGAPAGASSADLLLALAAGYGLGILPR